MDAIPISDYILLYGETIHPQSHVVYFADEERAEEFRRVYPCTSWNTPDETALPRGHAQRGQADCPPEDRREFSTAPHHFSFEEDEK